MPRRPLEGRQVSPVKHRQGDGKTKHEHERISGDAQNADRQVGMCWHPFAFGVWHPPRCY